eukprot:7578245-Pyramimonas_sp.AAC.1
MVSAARLRWIADQLAQGRQCRARLNSHRDRVISISLSCRTGTLACSIVLRPCSSSPCSLRFRTPLLWTTG